jgi:hypothetical protein
VSTSSRSEHARRYLTCTVAAKLYNTGFLLSFGVSFILYVTWSLVLPEKIHAEGHEDEPVTFEYMAQTDG